MKPLFPTLLNTASKLRTFTVLLFLSFFCLGLVHFSTAQLNRKAPAAVPLTGGGNGMFSDSSFQKARPLLLRNFNSTDGTATGRLSSGTACNTSTFQIRFQAGAEKIELVEIQTMPGGLFVIAANTITSSGQKKGILLLLNNNGTPVQQKAVEINGVPVALATVRITLGGKIVIAGITQSPTPKTILATFSSSFALQWAREYNFSSPPQRLTLEFTPEEAFLLAAQLSGSVVYSLINQTGTPVFTRELQPPGMKELLGFSLVVYTDFMLVVNCETGGKKNVFYAQIHPATGDLMSSHSTAGLAEEYLHTDVTSFNGRLIGVGISKHPSKPFQLVRNIIPSSAYIQTEHRYQLPGISNDFNTTLSSDNAGDAIGVCDGVAGQLFFIRHFADYQTPLEHVKRYPVPTGSSIRSVARSFIDGGYLFGVNTAAQGEIILLKTDSIGTIAGCSYQTLQVTDEEHLQINHTSQPSAAVTSTVTHTPAALQFSDQTLGSQTLCNQTYCPPDVQVNECLASYYKTYKSNSFVDLFGTLYPVRGDKKLIFTRRYERVLGNVTIESRGLKRFDESGQFEKGVNFFFEGTSGGLGATCRADSQHVIALFYSVKNNKPIFTFSKINDELQVVWTRTYEAFDNYFYSSFGLGGSLYTDEQGDIYFTATNPGFGGVAPRLLVLKLNSLGQQQWLKTYETATGLFLYSATIVAGNRVVVFLESEKNGNTSVSIDKNTGTLLSAYRFNNGAAGLIYKRWLGYADNKIFYVGNNSDEKLILAQFDTTGKPLVMKYSLKGGPSNIAALKDGKLYVIYDYFNDTDNKFKEVLLRMDNSFTPELHLQRDFLLNEYAVGMSVHDNGSIYVAGNHGYGGVNGNYYDPFLKKHEPDGTLGTCATQPATVPLLNLVPESTSLTFTTTPNQFTPVPALTLVLVNDSFGQRADNLLCSSDEKCLTVELNGPAAVCGLNQVTVFPNKKSPGCTLIPQLKFDTSAVAFVAQNDTSVSVRFKKTGAARLYLELNTGCKKYIDSLDVLVAESSPVISLGQDTVLCAGATLTLHAPAGYLQYQWQDLSNQPSYTVKIPGTYTVKIFDACGQFSSDTIIVTGAVVPPLFIGSDTSVCVKDTLTLTAGSGFSSYSWKGNGLLADTGRSVSYVSLNSSTLSLKAITVDGCPAFDTINIASKAARSFSLGNDTSFCSSDSLQLQTGNSYLQYLWSNGSQASSITVRSPGSYAVWVTDSNFCKTADTLRVLSVYSLPVVSLGADFNLCDGNSKKLDPGMFRDYLWQDGSGNRTYTASAAGNYWVRVTNANGCSSSDTVLVKNVFPLPSGFLLPTDSICQYETKLIGPLSSFDSYLWSTGSSQKSISISKPGTYVLRVRDGNGCAGNDSISVVQKFCRKGIYVPNAFTPNNDGLNDEFRAIVFGDLQYFQFDVYNRYGQLVFTTNDPQKGWNGVWNRIAQDPSVFVWKCSYRYEGETTELLYGTVTLIR